MAAEPANTTDSGDMEAHARDYSRFIAMLKWGAIISFILAMITVVMISE